MGVEGYCPKLYPSGYEPDILPLIMKVYMFVFAISYIVSHYYFFIELYLYTRHPTISCTVNNITLSKAMWFIFSFTDYLKTVL